MSVHGANRLGGNSLMETIIARTLGGQAAAEHALASPGTPGLSVAPMADAERDLQELLDRRDGERPWKIRDELGASMLENFGVFRQGRRWSVSSEIVQGLRERYERVVVEDKGRSSTPTSRRPSSSATCSTSRG